MKRWLAWLLIAVLCLCTVTACGEEGTTSTVQEAKLVFSCTGFDSQFSPFYAELSTDKTIAELTQLSLLTTDRAGEVIYNGINGETREYNGTMYTYTGPADLITITHDDGTVDYDFTLRTDLVFSDGTPITADDVIFTMYVLCDPTYSGPSSFASLPIAGLTEYRAGMIPKWCLILADTPKTAVTGSPDGYYTSEEAVAFWTIFNAVGAEFAQEITDWKIQEGWGTTVSEVAEAMGYSGLPITAMATDLFTAMTERYAYDISDEGIDSEKVDTSFEERLISSLTDTLLQGVEVAASASTITGIQKTGTHSLRVTLETADASALQQFCIAIAPKHHYGKNKYYNYELAQFGFVKGDLSSVRAKTAAPLGAGPYTYFRTNDGIVTLRANAQYYMGTPAVERLQFVKTRDTKLVSRLQDGLILIEDQPLDLTKLSEIETVNGGVLNGDILNAMSIDRTSYGYLGMSADGVCVGNNSSSEESKNLRRALATVFSYYRDASVKSYCNTNAAAINTIARDDWEEISSSAGFDTDIRGNGILTGRENEEQAEQAILEAALDFLRAAGYTVSNGIVTHAPQGGKLQFEVFLIGDEQGRNVAYQMLTDSKRALEKIGITLQIQDYAYDDELLNVLRNERAEIWCSTWVDEYNPDTYSMYFSGDSDTPAGGLQYIFDVDDPQLNECILAARRAATDAERTEQYNRCFEIIRDWAVEIPLYRQNHALVYRVESVEADTLPQDITSDYGWIRDIALTKLKKK